MGARHHPPAALGLVVIVAVAGCAGSDLYQGFGKTRPKPTIAEAPRPSPPKTTPRPQGPPEARNITVILEKYDAATVNAAGASLGLRARAGRSRVTVQGGPALARNGIHLSVGSPDLRARLRASASRRRSSLHQQLFITVADGQQGTLVVGSDVWVNRLGFWTPGGFVVLLERQFVGRSLVVRPRLLGGGRIAIELWPRFSTRRGKVVDLTQLATKVVVREGQPLVIGGLATGGESVGAVLFGLTSRQRTSSMTLVLTATVGGAEMQWPGRR